MIEWLQRVWNDDSMASATIHARTGTGDVFCHTRVPQFQRWKTVETTQDKAWTPSGDLSGLTQCATCRSWIDHHL